jgi:hypothetical protein
MDSALKDAFLNAPNLFHRLSGGASPDAPICFFGCSGEQPSEFNTLPDLDNCVWWVVTP